MYGGTNKKISSYEGPKYKMFWRVIANNFGLNFTEPLDIELFNDEPIAGC